MKNKRKNLANKGITLIALVITIIIILILARSITTNVNRR
jgi:type II secretory pathway pseudopilin PulG